MRRKLLFISIGAMIVSCAKGFGYHELIEKLKTYGDEYGFYFKMSGESSYIAYFMIDDSGTENLVMANNFKEGTVISYVFIELPSAEKTPGSFECLYTSVHETPEYYHIGSFHLSNDIYFNFTVTFDEYEGYDRDVGESSAQSIASLLLLVFDIWLQSDLNTNLKKVGLFPNFRDVKS